MEPVDIDKLKAALERVRKLDIGEDRYKKLEAMVEYHAFLGELVSEEGATMEGVRKRLSERFKIIPRRLEREEHEGGPAGEG